MYSPEEITKKYDSLSPEVKAILYSDEMLRTVTYLGGKHKLHLDQLDTLEHETAKVMKGETIAEDFPKKLTETLQVDVTTANAIAKDVSEALFSKIREGMKKTDESNKVEPKIVGTGIEPKPALATALPITIKTETPTPAPVTPPPPAPAPALPAVAPVADLPKPETPKMPPAPALAPVMPAIPVPPVSTTPHPDQILSEPTVSKVFSPS
ncbi:hypothetical protein KW798_01735, partial [Candidatus Parcubacteria bacterium]|nr:hypothetical protein [Candidatus Parcubacteria bacterium]